MVMAGFFFMRRCVAGDSARDANLAVLSPPPQPHAMNCEVLEDVLVYMQQHPDKHDQYAFNAGETSRVTASEGGGRRRDKMWERGDV